MKYLDIDMKRFIFLIIIPLLFFACKGTKPIDLGIKDGKLKVCSNMSNCINSQTLSQDNQYNILPITYTCTMQEEQMKLKKIILSIPRTSIIKEEPDYMYVEFTSFFMRSVDDVEFYFDDSSKVIHIRSASRISTSDWGENRKRIEEIRELLIK
jgi:uncharacterized protein (DUF1499 family)